MKFLLPLLRNNLLQLSHANQLRYADTKNRTKTITLYMLIAMILMGLLAYLIYSLKIIYSIAWSLEEVVTELVVPMVLICVILNIAISIFWGSGLLLSDTNIDSVLALPIPLRTLILSKLTVLFMVEVALTVALLLPMMVLFGLTAGMGFPFYLIVLGITILFPVIPGLLGTMFGTQIYRILKNSSARIARLKAAAAILILFAFMIFMFCKFPDIAAGNFGDVISTSTFTLYAGQYIHRLLNGDYLLIGIYFGGVFLIGVTLLYGLIKIFRNWYSNDAIQGSKSQPVDWNKQTTKQHSPVSALLERERTRYFSLPVYLTNTACGLLFAAVFVLLVVLMSDKITPYIYQLAEYFQVPFADYDVLFIYAFSILTTISCTTYVSISIEGKQIEILKSLPIAAKCLFRVKLLHHLSMSVPTIFVLNTIMASSSDCMRITFPASSPTSVSSNCPVTMSWNRPTLQILSNICGRKSRNRRSRKSTSDSSLQRSESTPICSSLTLTFSGSLWIKFISPRFTRRTRMSRALRSEKLRLFITSLVHLILRKQGSNPKQPKKKRKPA